MPDRHRPRSEPAATLFAAFRRAAQQRDPLRPEDWEQTEIQAVHAAAVEYANERAMPVPSLEDVEQARIFALGAFDFAATWAHRLSQVMHTRISSAP